MYHLSVKTISRAAGRSATAAIAYRTGCEIADERTGQTHDYTRKSGVEHAEIVLPSSAPSWANNRSDLWNAAEFAEKRINSTVAREFELGIPKALTLEQGVELVRDFTEQLVEKHGFSADFAIHKDDAQTWDGTEKGFDGYHAHILCTTRRMTKDGLGEKTRELDGMQAGRENVAHWRERWAVTANRHLALADQEQRIDHRSLKDQGIDREATQHMGPTATALERRGIPTLAGEANRRIEAAYQQGIEDRQALAAMRSERIELDTSLERAKRVQVRVQELTQYLETGADAFVQRFEEQQRQQAQEKKQALERQMHLEKREFEKQKAIELAKELAKKEEIQQDRGRDYGR